MEVAAAARTALPLQAQLHRHTSQSTPLAFEGHGMARFEARLAAASNAPA